MPPLENGLVNNVEIEIGARVLVRTVFEPFPQAGTVIGKHSPEGQWQVWVGDKESVLLWDYEIQVLSDLEYMALVAGSCDIK